MPAAEEPWESRTPVRIGDVLGRWNLLPEYETDVAQARAKFLLIEKHPLEEQSEAERRACAFWMGLGFLDPPRQLEAVRTFRSPGYTASLLARHEWDPVTGVKWRNDKKAREAEQPPPPASK